jgi:hypothetical protein
MPKGPVTRTSLRASLLSMAMTAQHLPPQLDEISDVLRCVGNAPRVRVPQGWRLDMGPDTWRILANGTSDARTAGHQVLLGAGIAAEHLVVALEARHLRVEVSELPTADPRAVIAVRVLGRAHPSALMTTLRDIALEPAHRLPSPGRLITASDLRVLNLTAEARSAEVLWPSELAGSRDLRGQQIPGQQTVPPRQDGLPCATLVTRGDTPKDRVHGGRALGRLLLRAAALGLDARTELDDLSSLQDLQASWGIGTTPQAQFTLSGRT